MDNQDQRRAHTPGHESHGVHLCHKCGWPFPNPHPSAKHRRAHKKICGTIEGYKLCVAEGQVHMNGSDDEHASDDDHKTPRLVVSGPNAVDSGNNEKSDDVIREKSIRSEDEVFSDAVADFSDGGLNQGIKEHLHDDSLDSGTNEKKVGIKDPKLSSSSEDNGFNDMSQLTVKSSDDCKIQNPKVLQIEIVEVGNTFELQGQLSGSTMDTLSSSIADLRAEELTVVCGDDSVAVSGDPCPSKAETIPDDLPENKAYAGEDVMVYNLTCHSKETNLKRKDEIKSDGNEVEIAVPSDNVVNETFEGESKIAVSDSVQSDRQVADGAVHLKEKNIAEFLSVTAQDNVSFELNSVIITDASTNEAMTDQLPDNKIYADEDMKDCSLTFDAKETNLKNKDEIKSDINEVKIVVPSDNVVVETFEGETKTVVSDSFHSDHQAADGAVDLKEENSVEFLSVPTQDDNPIELNSAIIMDASTNDFQVEPAHVIQFATSSDVNNLQEKEEGNVNVDTLSTCDDRPDVANPQSDHEDFKDIKGVVLQTPLSIHSSLLLKQEEGDLKDSVTKENDFVFYPSQWTEKNVVLSPDMDSVDSNSSLKEELVNSEPMAEEMHAEDSNDVIPVKLKVESYERIDEIGVSMNAVKTEVNENHMLQFSKEEGPDDVHKNSQQISSPEGCLMALPSENLMNASFGSGTSETTGVISIDNISNDEKNRTEINDVAVDAKYVGANVENNIGTRDFQSTGLQSEVNQPCDLFKSGDAGEMDKIEKCDITDAQCQERPIAIDTSLPQSASSHIESPVILEAVTERSTEKSEDTECTDIGPMSVTQEDKKEDEINCNVKVHEECEKSVDTSADSDQAPDAELLVKAAEDLSGKHVSLPSLNTKPSSRHDSAVGDNQDGERGREMPGITAISVQDRSVNNLFKHSSSGIDASVDSGSRCDSLEGNWGSISVLSMQSDAPAVTDTETLQSTGSLASTEAGKFNSNNTKASSERQQSGKSEMFEAPSFMTLVEPAHVASPKAAASEVQRTRNLQQPSSTSQAGWFPTLTQVVNESQGRKKNEEIIARVTNWSASKEHTPLKSLLGEAAHSNKPKSPKMEENSVNKQSGKLPENNGSGLTTVNSILGPESPVAQALKGDAAKEWNSPARYPADMKREKRKVKSRPYWIQLVCCSTVDPRRR